MDNHSVRARIAELRKNLRRHWRFRYLRLIHYTKPNVVGRKIALNNNERIALACNLAILRIYYPVSADNA